MICRGILGLVGFGVAEYLFMFIPLFICYSYLFLLFFLVDCLLSWGVSLLGLGTGHGGAHAHGGLPSSGLS